PSLILTSIGTQIVNPRVYWRGHQHEYPILANVARDVLTTPASGSGVERLSNSVWDICHYRRGLLKPKTIKELMFMCTTKFDMESKQLSLMEEYFTTQETQAAEEKDAWKKQDEFNPISDDEDELSSAGAISQIPLPDNSYLQGKSSTQRRSSGRLPKRSRRDDDFVYG
ncbi:uncharacterized protein ASPGLDRAFT_137232, partial [Aspergillus glaucus CBS 516.65]